MFKPKFYASFLLLPALLCGILAFKQPNETENYIDKYSLLAVQEMHRSGIPASITIAQAIIESSWGKGSLALNSKNFFGIKCKEDWNGPSYYYKDDDFENGQLIKSCFRAYENVEDSFADHTTFLQENSRYARLFNYTKTDYVSWARGLKSCGYATAPDYAQKLIALVEKYNLNRFDYIEEIEPMIVMSPISRMPLPITSDAIVVTSVPSSILGPPTNVYEPTPPKAYELPEAYIRNSGPDSYAEETKEEVYTYTNDPDPVVEQVEEKEEVVVQTVPSYNLNIQNEEITIPNEINEVAEVVIPTPYNTIANEAIIEIQEEEINSSNDITSNSEIQKNESITVYENKIQSGGILLSRAPIGTAKRRF